MKLYSCFLLIFTFFTCNTKQSTRKLNIKKQTKIIICKDDLKIKTSIKDRSVLGEFKLQMIYQTRSENKSNFKLDSSKIYNQHFLLTDSSYTDINQFSGLFEEKVIQFSISEFENKDVYLSKYFINKNTFIYKLIDKKYKFHFKDKKYAKFYYLITDINGWRPVITFLLIRNEILMLYDFNHGYVFVFKRVRKGNVSAATSHIF